MKERNFQQVAIMSMDESKPIINTFVKEGTTFSNDVMVEEINCLVNVAYIEGSDLMTDKEVIAKLNSIYI